ncbi:MAG TPA: DUF4398 domain-containing protein [Candidatus Binatia bacterium]|jgi:hypothetical protein
MRLSIFLDRRTVGAALLLASFLSLGCGAVSNPALERARDAYNRARQDREIVGRAAVALDKARLTLEQAERVWTADKDVLEVEHLAYIAEKRIEIARATARKRLAADDIQQLNPQRE